MDDDSDDLDFERLRAYAFAIAYRMLSSVADAEDVVQESLLRLSRVHDRGEAIASPRALLATITTRLAITELTSVRARREQYVGEWLPEPIVTDDRDAPEARAEIADSLSTATLVVLETLSPEQRAVLLLHDVFDYPFPEIARILGTTAANARQLAARARRHVRERRPRFPTTEQHHRELTTRFIAAARSGDVGALESLLTADVVFTGDGGGKVPALSRPLLGRMKVAETLADWFRSGPPSGPNVSVEVAEVNAAGGAVFRDRERRVLGVWALTVDGGRISRVDSVVNPEKLSHLGPVGDFAAILGGDA